MAASLLLGLGISSWMFLRERRAKQEQAHLRQEAQTEAAKSQQVARFFKRMLKGAGPEVAKGRDATILLQILDDA